MVTAVTVTIPAKSSEVWNMFSKKFFFTNHLVNVLYISLFYKPQITENLHFFLFFPV